jgi:hypothetical protein
LSGDDCKAEIVEQFDYPGDLNRLPALGHICRDTVIATYTEDGLLPTVTIWTKFSDRNYILLGYENRARFVFDRRNDLIFCFSKFTGATDFDRSSILHVYLVDRNLMPMFSITRELDNGHDTLSVEHYDYSDTDRDKQMYRSTIRMSDIDQPSLDTLTYSDLVRWARDLLQERYTRVSDPRLDWRPFGSIPCWTDD